MDQLSNFVAHSSHRAQIAPSGRESSEISLGLPQHSAEPESARLNPYFVENLMGWLLDWTSTHEHSASSAAATELWRSKLQQRLSNFFDAQGV